MWAWALKLIWGNARVIGLVLGVLVAWWYIDHKGYERGYTDKEAEIVAQDKEAIDEADTVRLGVRECNATPGMHFDTVTGKCVRR